MVFAVFAPMPSGGNEATQPALREVGEDLPRSPHVRVSCSPA